VPLHYIDGTIGILSTALLVNTKIRNAIALLS